MLIERIMMAKRSLNLPEGLSTIFMWQFNYHFLHKCSDKLHHKARTNVESCLYLLEGWICLNPAWALLGVINIAITTIQRGLEAMYVPLTFWTGFLILELLWVRNNTFLSKAGNSPGLDSWDPALCLSSSIRFLMRSFVMKSILTSHLPKFSSQPLIGHGYFACCR